MSEKTAEKPIVVSKGVSITVSLSLIVSVVTVAFLLGGKYSYQKENNERFMAFMRKQGQINESNVKLFSALERNLAVQSERLNGVEKELDKR